MFNILVFEDDLVIQSGIKKIVSELFASLNRPITIHNTTSVRETIECADKTTIDLFLLDIAIPDNVNAGIDIGKQLVSDRRYKNTPIIYITANPNAVFEAINKTHCYQFLEKPFHKKDLVNAITTILENNKITHDSYITIEVNGKRFRLIKDDIAIIESMNHDVTVWMRNDVIVIRNYSLKQMLDNLDETFFQCHKSYVVSKNYIKLIDMGKSEIKTIVAGKAIPIGRAFKKNL